MQPGRMWEAGWSAGFRTNHLKTEYQVRLLKCRIWMDHSMAYVDDEICESFGIVRPPSSRACHDQNCPRWDASEWTEVRVFFKGSRISDLCFSVPSLGASATRLPYNVVKSSAFIKMGRTRTFRYAIERIAPRSRKNASMVNLYRSNNDLQNYALPNGGLQSGANALRNAATEGSKYDLGVSVRTLSNFVDATSPLRLERDSKSGWKELCRRSTTPCHTSVCRIEPPCL